MALPIIFLILFIIGGSFVIYFVFGIFHPVAKNQTGLKNDPLFSDAELNYINSNQDKDVKVSNLKAFVMCSPERTFPKERLNYNGIKNCTLFRSIYLSKTDCIYGCIGYGDCVTSCPQEAIIIKNNTAVITSNCCGCGQCLNICPVDLIKLMPYSKDVEGHPIKLCNVPAGSNSTCSQCNRECQMSIPENSNFKIWKSLHKAIKK